MREGLGDPLLDPPEGVQLRPLLHGGLDQVGPVVVADGLRGDALLRAVVRLEPQRRLGEGEGVLLLVLLLVVGTSSLNERGEQGKQERVRKKWERTDGECQRTTRESHRHALAARKDT